jgi:proteasome lid subunit RPN8/RPN11
MNMRIAPGVLAEIRRHLAAAYPTEGCGLLLGTRGPNGDVVVCRQLPVPNRRAADAGGRTRYLIGPEDFLTAEREARQASLVVVGTYHSHPDVPARPSAYDTEHAWPRCCYLIASVAGGDVREERVWELHDDRSGFVERALEVKES